MSGGARPRRRRHLETTGVLQYLEDLAVGTELPCGSFSLSREDIIDFAAKYDPQPFHLDDAAAARSYFETLCASGVHTQAAAIGLMVRAIADVAVIAGGSLDQARFYVPARPGLRYDVTARWTETRPSARNPERGIAIIRGVTRHGGTDVMDFGVTYVVARRR